LVTRKMILITGRVQGIGFRPAVYRIARTLGLTGFVYNDTKGVTIELQGEEGLILEFLKRLHSTDGPRLAEIDSCNTFDAEPIEGEQGFTITGSTGEGAVLSRVTADIATCDDCLSEMRNKKDFRYQYPFINCTNCGPRYSIVKTIPYDRCNTTMSPFQMCHNCATQYQDIEDRRFHAQPVACGKCGPKIWLTDANGNTLCEQIDEVITQTARLLRDGKIAAIKGVGGFHLAVDALNDEAVRELRRRKKRDHKPFAMMTASPDTIRKYADLSDDAERLLQSPAAPIVLLPKKKNSPIAPSVAQGTDTFGFMLCYAPLHYLLFEEGPEVLVMTSGNISDEPLICKNDEALQQLGDIADVFLMHDREIYRQVDDSVVHFIDGESVPLRRARGYVPTPVVMNRSSEREIFAAGSDLKNTFCFVKENQLICSEHIGDLADADVYLHYIESAEHLAKLFEAKPQLVVCDLHPAYLSSEYARGLAGAELIEVQHHWAHIASVMAEHGIDEPVIGLACDGTGYGTDGAIWGCECLIATLKDFERFGHLSYYLLAGGDAASKEAIRCVLGLLFHTFGQDLELSEFDWLLEQIEPEQYKCRKIAEQIRKRVNAIETSSLGRLFDAVAAMVGLGNYNHFEAQLPMALEAIAAKGIDERYEFEIIEKAGSPAQLDLRKMLRSIIEDVRQAEARKIISAKFHNTISAGLVEMARLAAKQRGLKTVALSGGVFCNRYLANRLITELKCDGFNVLFNRHFPANDGGISVGQAAIATALTTRRT